ncbi:MAG: ATP-binding protein [Prevotella sp.]|nr:ATP-binding protein [Prevotella sp.]
MRGYYPYYEKYAPIYPEIIQQTITAIIDEDLNVVQDIAAVTRNKFKRLLYIISQQVPFVPNISNIGQTIEATRKQTYEMISTLERAALINSLYSGKADFSQLTKPKKIYLENTNMMHALSSHVDKGNDRETFFANQLKEGHRLSYTGKGDFLIDGCHTVEVGGKGKNFDQIKDIPDSYIASDDIEYGYGNHIPLWLFGFLY